MLNSGALSLTFCINWTIEPPMCWTCSLWVSILWHGICIQVFHKFLMTQYCSEFLFIMLHLTLQGCLVINSYWRVGWSVRLICFTVCWWKLSLSLLDRGSRLERPCGVFQRQGERKVSGWVSSYKANIFLPPIHTLAKKKKMKTNPMSCISLINTSLWNVSPIHRSSV